jgi:hypothetical protein
MSMMMLEANDIKKLDPRMDKIFKDAQFNKSNYVICSVKKKLILLKFLGISQPIAHATVRYPCIVSVQKLKNFKIKFIIAKNHTHSKMIAYSRSS